MKKITMIVILAFLAMTLSIYLIFSLQNNEIEKLDRPNILGLFCNYELVWNSVEHADYYEIKVNDDFYKNVTTNSYKFVSYQFMYTVDHFEPLDLRSLRLIQMHYMKVIMIKNQSLFLKLLHQLEWI